MPVFIQGSGNGFTISFSGLFLAASHSRPVSSFVMRNTHLASLPSLFY